jgi:hypothetical protein
VRDQPLRTSVFQLAALAAAMLLGVRGVVCAASSPSARTAHLIPGGLDAVETGYGLGPNLLINGDLRGGDLSGWKLNPSCFTLDRSGGLPSLRLKVPCPQQYPAAKNEAVIPPGLYRIGAEIKTEALASGIRGRYGARIVLSRMPPAHGWYFTRPALHGTNDWTGVYRPHIGIPDGSGGVFSAGLVRKVDSGIAWFRNLWVRRETPPPLRAFLMYPNFRGLMFSDQSQAARIAVSIHPPSGTPMSKLSAVIEVRDSGGKLLASHRFSPPPGGSFVATIDMASLPLGKYQLQGTLEAPGRKRLFTQSSYTVIKASKDARAAMKAWIDPDNIIHIAGKPRFIIGIYDTTGYSFLSKAYEPRLAKIAKAPINLIINYFLANGKAGGIYAYTTAMSRFGISHLATVNNFFEESHAYPRWARGTVGPDTLISKYCDALADDRGAIGYYTCDECMTDRQPRTFHQYTLIKEHDPGSVTFAVINPTQIQYWRDSVDVFGVDPYPIGISKPMSIVGDITREAEEGVDYSRPVWTVIQFFRRNRASRFPTQRDLHDMSWTAIAEGARGVLYWSYGVRGLHWGKRDPALMQQRYDALVNVAKEIQSLEPALIDKDRPVLGSNSAAGTVITKQKAPAGGARYVIAYNHGGDNLSVDFTLLHPARAVAVVGENRSVELDKRGLYFNDTFAPYQAHVYKIDD